MINSIVLESNLFNFVSNDSNNTFTLSLKKWTNKQNAIKITTYKTILIVPEKEKKDEPA